MMVRCPKCKKEHEDNSKECPFCGWSWAKDLQKTRPHIANTDDNVTVLPWERGNQNAPIKVSVEKIRNAVPHKKKNRIPAVLLCALILLTIALSLPFILGKAKLPIKDKLYVKTDSAQSSAEEIDNENSLKDAERIYEAVANVMLKTAFEHYEIGLEDKTVTVKIQMEGGAKVATLAINGDEKALQAWDTMKDDFYATSKIIEASLEDAQLPETLISIQLINESDNSLVLFSMLNGGILYDCVKDSQKEAVK